MFVGNIGYGGNVKINRIDPALVEPVAGAFDHGVTTAFPGSSG
ncbi:MAG: hypothetical protein U0175_12320 [Caldilineaceae bacterium]